MIAFLFLFFFLLAVGSPIYLAIGAVTALLFVADGHNLGGYAQVIVDHLNSSTLMSVPFFVMAATFMEKGNIAKVLIAAANTWLGRLHGGTALICVLAATIFASISGSSLATAMAMGTILIPSMLAQKYARPFALGVVGASGTLGILIPPSLALIIYGIVAELSVPKLFLAGVVPGILQATLLGLWVYFYARRKAYFPTVPESRSQFLQANLKAVPALGMPVLVLGGIYTGIVTISEAAILAAVLAIILSTVIYRQCKLAEILPIIVIALRQSAALIIIVAFAMALGHWITYSGLPQHLVSHIATMGLQPWQFLLLVNLMMLGLGMFLEVISVILITLPIILPLLDAFNISPIHFAIILTVNMELALLTPPVGLNLFVLSNISKAPLAEVIKGVLPFILLLLLFLLVVIFVPQLSTWLPELVYGD